VRVETPPGKDVSVHLRFERGGSAGVSGDMDLPLAASNSIIRQGNCWILKNSFAWSDLTPA
jgi:hypothetical protein